MTTDPFKEVAKKMEDAAWGKPEPAKPRRLLPPLPIERPFQVQGHWEGGFVAGTDHRNFETLDEALALVKKWRAGEEPHRHYRGVTVCKILGEWGE